MEAEFLQLLGAPLGAFIQGASVYAPVILFLILAIRWLLRRIESIETQVAYCREKDHERLQRYEAMFDDDVRAIRTNGH